MDPRNTPSVKVQKDSRGFPAGLTSVVQEWLLIFLLFVNAVFSFFVTKFARSNKLQTPCLLCSRLDHVIGNENLGFYKDLICGAHKLEISSLVYCHIHDKLADVRDMCEGCLFSFTSENKSNPEAKRFLVGKLGTSLESYFYQDASIKDTSSKKQCSCCKETWTSRSFDQTLFQTKSVGSENSGGCSHVNYGDGLGEEKKNKSGQLKTSYLRSRSFEALSHIGYSELKFTSESESEIPISDDDDDDDDDEDASTMAQNGDGLNEEFVYHCVQPESATGTSPALPDDLTTETLISRGASPAHSVQVPNEQIDAGDPDYLTPVLSDRAASPLISVQIPNEQIDVDEPDYITPSLSNRSGSPLLSVQSPTEHVDVGEPRVLTPLLSNRSGSPLLSVLVPNEKTDARESDYLTPLASADAIGHGLEELDWHEAEEKVDPPTTPTVVSLNAVPLSHIAEEASGETLDTTGTGLDQAVKIETEKICELENDQITTTGPFSKKDKVVGESGTGLGQVVKIEPEIVCELENDRITTTGSFLKKDEVVREPETGLDEAVKIETEIVCELENQITTTGSCSKKDEVVGKSETGLDQAAKIETEKVRDLENDQITTTGSCSEKNEVVGVLREALDAEETGNTGEKSVGASEEIRKLETGSTNRPGLKTDSVSNDVGPTNPNLVNPTDSLKLVIGKGNQISTIFAEQLTPKNSTINEDLKLLLSQAARGIESSSNDMSPRAHVYGDDLRRITIERSESGIESLDGSIVSEVDGESVVERLKRQIEHDRKIMNALYKELEEERNASAIAANQAMAMITRLQEEKASLHMEALQYLRMMEEQAEYDVDALQKANDLLAEKEKEMQDLEAELAIYRNKFPNVDEMQDSWCDLNGGDKKVEHSDVSCSNLPNNNSLLSKKSEDRNKQEKIDTRFGDNYMNPVEDSLSEFDDERLYISQCLKKLEIQLSHFSSNGVYLNKSNGGYSGKECHGVNISSQLNGQLEEDGSSVKDSSSLEREDPSAQEKSNSLVGNHHLSKENHHSDSDAQEESVAENRKRKEESIVHRGTDLVALENEVSDLNERLEALESNRNFLEHTINALQNSDEGMQFVQEIAHHLRELRRIGIKRIEQTIT